MLVMVRYAHTNPMVSLVYEGSRSANSGADSKFDPGESTPYLAPDYIDGKSDLGEPG